MSSRQGLIIRAGCDSPAWSRANSPSVPRWAAVADQVTFFVRTPALRFSFRCTTCRRLHRSLAFGGDSLDGNHQGLGLIWAAGWIR